MTDSRLGGLALILGSALLILTMAMHPTGHDLLDPDRSAVMVFVNMFAHALGFISMPITFLGALALSLRLNSPQRHSIAALVMYGFAQVAGMGAVLMSGYIATGAARQILRAGEGTSAAETWYALMRFTGLMNQGFTQVLVFCSCVAIVLWSVEMVRRRLLSRPLGIYGIAAATLILLAQLSGRLRFDIHGFGLVVILQSVWFISAGILLRREPAFAGTN